MTDEIQNPLLAKLKLPGRTFQLPSLGAGYTAGELGVPEGEVHVHALSALAEITLKNPDLLFNGKAVEAVFSECVPEIKRPTELYAKDIDALMFYLRLVTYGSEFQINVKHNCEHAKERSYLVNLEQELQRFKKLDPTVFGDLATVELPNGQRVRVRPLKFDHLIKLFQLNANKTEFSEEDRKTNLIFNLLGLIEEVDGIKDRKLIEEWLRKCTAPMHAAIGEAAEKINDFGPQPTTELRCKDCNELMNVELPLNPVNFFIA